MARDGLSRGLSRGLRPGFGGALWHHFRIAQRVLHEERAVMTASVSTAAGIKPVRCPRCGNVFDCGRTSEPFDCWCRTLPALPASRVDPRGRCMCPECLADAAARAAAGAGNDLAR
jgi:hypothetical protein